MKTPRRFLVAAAAVIFCCVSRADAQPNAPAPVPAASPQPMRIHIINVGQAEAILLEFPKAAVMIDAGGEETNDAQLRDHLIDYLTTFFQRRTDLQAADHRGIIDTIVVSHPHIDHTMQLFDVVRAFHVRNLIDGGNTSGSGIEPLGRARQFVASHQGRYVAVRDSRLSRHYTPPTATSALSS
jgi:beta-lactamase superfamily II metal-dependent hydrolase